VRKLHVVGFTTDLDGLIFSTRKGSASGSFVLPISDELYEKLAEAERLRNGGEASDAESGAQVARRAEGEGRPGRPESALTPREIQARLRTGRTIEDVAREAGVTADWVDRFARPILAEQAQIVEVARAMTFSKPRLGPSAEPLGRSVARNLVDRGVRLLDEEFDGGWSAYQLHDGVWMVRFQYHSRARALSAAWEVDVSAGHLTARDRHASDLGYIEPGRRRSAAVPGEDGEAGASDVEGEPATNARTVTPPTARPAAGRRAATSRPRRPRVPTSALPRTAVESAAKRPVPPSKAGTKAGAKVGSKAGATPAKGAKAAKVTKDAKATKAAKTAKVPKAKAATTPTAKRASRAVGRKASSATRAAAAPATSSVSRPRRAARATAGTRLAEAPNAPTTAARPDRPKFGTDGTQLAKASNRPRPRPATPPAVPRTPVPPPAPLPPAAPPARSVSRGLVGLTRSTPPAGAQNGSAALPTRPAAAPGPPPQVPRPYEPRRAAPRPVPAPIPAAAPVSSRNSDRGRFDVPPGRPRPLAPVDDLAMDELDLNEVMPPPRQPDPEPAARGGILGRRRPAPPEEPPGDDEQNDRDRPGGQDAFVIRPRISAKQASEFAFNDDRPR